MIKVSDGETMGKKGVELFVLNFVGWSYFPYPKNIMPPFTTSKSCALKQISDESYFGGQKL